MVRLLILGIVLFLLSCSPSQLEIPGLEEFDSYSMKGTDSKLYIKSNEGGRVLEKGIINNGLKDGTWMTYHENEQVKTISSYAAGRLNGTYLELNDRGYIEHRADYFNDKLHGQVINYNFGRMTKLMSYKDGVFHGPFNEYSNRGKISRSGEFRNGQQHGLLQYFNDEGDLIMEYQYDNGKKISGGIIEVDK